MPPVAHEALRAALPDGPAWSVAIRSLDGSWSAEADPHRCLPAASAAKVLLLVVLAERLAGLPAALTRRDDDSVGDSGLWQHLRVASLPPADLGALVGATSDNLATNVLLRAIGLDAVGTRARSLGLTGTALHDRVRDSSGPGDPPTLSTATASDLAQLMTRLHQADGISPANASLVLAWLSLGSDLSMVASALDLDPLAHGEPDRGVRLVNKTGTDAGVRADIGLIVGPADAVAYAALASWPSRVDLRRAAMSGMRGIGRLVAECVGAP